MRKIFFLIATIGLLQSCGDDSVRPEVDRSYVYFMVAERDETHGDSYILPLKDAGDIEQAREMIADPQKAKIVVAEINKITSGHVNRDLKRNKTYSWRVAGFLGFADTTIEIYDGWPIYVEDNYEDWVRTTKGDNGNGIIGFWGYTIVREVSPSELE